MMTTDYPRTYDTALPQEWYDSAYAATKINPAGHVVWSYDEAKMWGAPYAVDAIGDLTLLLVTLRDPNSLNDPDRDEGLIARAHSALTKLRMEADQRS